MLGKAHGLAPSPNARVFGGAGTAWEGAEGESAPDPVTPGVTWLGGPRGGTRCEGVTHVTAGEPNGGDVAAAPQNLAFRDVSLEEVEARCRLEATRVCAASADAGCRPASQRALERSELVHAAPYWPKGTQPRKKETVEPAYTLNPAWYAL